MQERNNVVLFVQDNQAIVIQVFYRFCVWLEPFAMMF